MKTTALFAALASASAVAPPRISLNLEGMTQAYKLQESIVRTHDQGYKNYNHTTAAGQTLTSPEVAVKSQQDWTEKCPAKQATATNCPQPVAQAYDHFDKAVDVTTRLFLVDFEGTATTAAGAATATIMTKTGMVQKSNSDALEIDLSQCSVDYNHKATYLFKYDAKDAAGNYAEQVVFALILDDTRSPWFDQSPTEDSKWADGTYSTEKATAVACVENSNRFYEPALTVEAVSDWRLCQLSANDNYDERTDVTAAIRYQIEYLGRGSADFTAPAPIWHTNKNHKAVNESKIPQDGYTWDQQWQVDANNGVTTGRLEYAAAALIFNRDCKSHTFDRSDPEWDDKEVLVRCGPEQVGKYLVTATTNDFAGVYGHDAVNNQVQLQTAILIQDTTAPTIYLEGHNPVFVECSLEPYTAESQVVDAHRKGYKEMGALCHDKLDTDALGQRLEVTFFVEGTTAANYTDEPDASCPKSDDTNTIGCVVKSDDNNVAIPTDSYSVATLLSHNDQTTGGTATRYINYACKDFALNAAATVQRTIRTVDTEAPTLILAEPKGHAVIYSEKHCMAENRTGVEGCIGAAAAATFMNLMNSTLQDGVSTPDMSGYTAVQIACLKGVKQDSCERDDHMTDSGYETGTHTIQANGFADAGVKVGTTLDRCDGDITDSSVTMSWGPKPFNARILGDYVRTYTVSDFNDNVATKTRTFTVIDEDQPIIEIQGVVDNSADPYNANRDIEYTDAGATCQDWVDGELSHAVEVSGEVVNYRIPGTYHIQYNCQDLTGNEAEPLTRTVVIKDKEDPHITLNGAIVNFIEAGFPYIDAGATATDTLDGDITQYIWTSGDTVNDRRAYYAYSDCSFLNETKLNAPYTGEYFLTLKDDSGKFHRELVFCAHAGTQKIGFKLVTDVVAGNHHCNKIGMQVMDYDSADTITKETISGLVSTDDLDQVSNTSVKFLCELSASATDASDEMNKALGVVTDQVQNAEQGEYTIAYHVEDKAGRTQANSPIRTVIVKDTLPPVVSLSMQRDAKIQSEKAEDATRSVFWKFPAVTQHTWSRTDQKARHGHNFYMAEASGSANGFFIGAIASAVAGVALLGLSMRKSSQTSVPV
jgi:hypothetical protein